MRIIFISFIFIFFTQGLFAKPSVDRLISVPLSSVKVEGEMGRRIDVTIQSNLLELMSTKIFWLHF